MKEKEGNSKDFRVTRHKLPPDAFAVGSEIPEEPPGDLIEEDIWNHIISFPDDVILRTTDNHGTELKTMYNLWKSWIDLLGEDQDVIWHVMLDAADEFQACLFNALCGYYRIGASCLRSVLELITLGTYFQLFDKTADFDKWREGGYGKIGFGTACDRLMNHSRVKPLEKYLQEQMHYSIFKQKSNSNPEGGWARKLFSELSDFAHSRPTHSSASLWEGSNGPIYVPLSFGKIYTLYLDTTVLGYVLIKLARPSFELPRSVLKYIFSSPTVKPSKVAVYSCRYFWKWP